MRNTERSARPIVDPILNSTSAARIKTIGVLGGMGPLATVCFLQRVVEQIKADRDQDYVPIILNCAPQIPDRSAAILRKGKSPLPELKRALAQLEAVSPDFVCMPCNTAHFWYAELTEGLAIPFVHIVDPVIHKLNIFAKSQTCVGLLATNATIKAEIYQQRAGKSYEWTIPDDITQYSFVDSAIGLIKGGRQSDAIPLIRQAMRYLVDVKHVRIIVLGCTELSLIADWLDPEVIIVDSAGVLARWVADYALGARIDSQ
jgi:aspartate racemase